MTGGINTKEGAGSSSAGFKVIPNHDIGSLVFNGLMNGASALFVKDIYQNFLPPKAANRE